MPDDDIDDLLRALREVADPHGPDEEAERRVLTRLDGTLGTPDRSLRSGFRNARRAVLAIVAAAGVLTGAAGTAAVAIAAGGTAGGHTTSGSVQSRTLPGVAANPDAVSYAAVTRSEVRASGSTRRLLRVLARQFPDIDPQGARGIAAADGTRGWVIPGTKHTCFGADNSDGTGYTCVANARARLGALSSAAVDDRGRIRAIYLVPDDVDRLEVGGRTFRPHNNLVVATYTLEQPVTIVTDNGAATVVEGQP